MPNAFAGVISNPNILHKITRVNEKRVRVIVRLRRLPN